MIMKVENYYQKGFTLVELIVAIVILAILVGIAIPSFTDLIRNNQTSSQTNEFIRDINLARSEAVKRGTRVIVCKSTNGNGCTGGNWEQGWIIFADNNANGSVDAQETIRVNQGLENGFTLRVGVTFSDWIAYEPSGAIIGNGGTPTGNIATDAFRLCRPEASTNDSRQTIFSPSGRAQVTEGTASCP